MDNKIQIKNPIKAVSDTYKSIIPNPTILAIALLSIGIPIAYAGRSVIKKQLRDTLQDPRAAATLGMTPRLVQQNLDLLLNTTMGKYIVPIGVGSLPAVTSVALNFKSDHPYYGMFSWPYLNKKLAYLNKKASMWLTPGYQPQLDFSKSINTLDTQQMFQSNPFLQDDSYVKNFGTSIINAAPSYGNTTTLGGVYDSALNKFLNKLDFQGIGNKALKGYISGSLAGMFTDVVGTVMGVPDPLRTRLANSVGVGKALYDILT